MVSVELEFINHAVNPIRDICIGDKVMYTNIFSKIALIQKYFKSNHKILFLNV